MIGRIDLPSGVVAVLGDDLKWSSQNTVVADYLNALFAPDPDDFSPAMGAPGRWAVVQAAFALQAKPVFPAGDGVDKAPAGVVY